ncbi:Rrf2 family transcriptional regulator [Candidatus Galacturonibacter soehngenii]|uniref:Rrf2 family transcriptional regulator n=1 Tax=Candidatus Galacturonatibacter soehngenii TaxID=2307010 RepID=A0A7V7QMK2_9FIRM|nr:Rrf2 family transcriptional regulator [Candidatus Galacturonibacter soehngenii]KAB1439488.1 Rrf2 family transcriptional regulator [Candidatus Galacturonibacter soehngenii]MBA4687001.1 Rrf2 family transcriptional regulator [Candidatus Galacturonibacter soehngenii]
MYSTKLSVSIHILSVIALMGEKPVTSEYIASSINTNPALVRRLMSRLKRAKFIETSTKLGVMGLAKEAKDITLLDIFFAVEDQTDLFSIHGNTNQNCPIGAKIEITLKDVYDDIQNATKQKLAAVTLADIIKEFK